MKVTHQLTVLLLAVSSWTYAQTPYELNSGWQCRAITSVPADGATISTPAYSLAGWLPAVVPGTVLTTLLANRQVPDPFYGMNNERIPDIYRTGRDYYTYWFTNDFRETAKAGEQVWLHLRGVNYSCDVFLNGKKLNPKRHEGMFLRQVYNITPHLRPDGKNRLAVVVYPPDPVGNPNGGQGGDGTVARTVSHQYVAGWDWIQPVRDRNTGIWDKVTIEKTGTVCIKNPHVVTRVPGKRQPDGNQQPALIRVTVELENAASTTQRSTLTYRLDGHTVTKTVSLAPHSTQLVALPDLSLSNPKLWWPNGYGAQHLYGLRLQVQTGNLVSDRDSLRVGIREVQTEWNPITRSKQVSVNGQKVFIKGGNWIVSDAMLRLSPERYNAEVRFHRDMNLNLIRVWGGALLERPEFYEACDTYGLLVMQDFWGSGDCNGRWVDPMKKDDQWTRRQYPDDHALFLTSAADQIKMIRNHPSLAIWCGGNEITLPQDIMNPLRDSILTNLDGTRWFIDYSNSDDMSYNFLGGNGDGPYGIQPVSRFWSHRTWPFNSEVGSVGLSDYASLERFIPKQNLTAPLYTMPDKRNRVDSVWEYHKYIGYDAAVDAYGKATDVRDFAKKAQLVNYDQYRGLMEGFSAHMWDWYTGVIIWKTQNPWTAMRGQMYDYYLDPNACLYGLHNGSEPLHIMFNPVDSMVMIANNTVSFQRDLMMVIRVYDMAGKDSTLTQVFSEIGPSLIRPYVPIGRTLRALGKDKGLFLSLRLLDLNKQIVSDNLYWLPDSTGTYSGLQHMGPATVQVQARQVSAGKLAVTLTNPAGNPVAFFNRLSLVDSQTKKRLLPVFYSDNYVSVLPGETKTVQIDYTPTAGITPQVALEGWNVVEQYVTVH